MKENIKKKFQDEKLACVDEVVQMDQQVRRIISEVEALRNLRNTTSKEIGALMRSGKKDEAEKAKAAIAGIGDRIAAYEVQKDELAEKIRQRMCHPQHHRRVVPIGPRRQ